MIYCRKRAPKATRGGFGKHFASSVFTRPNPRHAELSSATRLIVIDERECIGLNVCEHWRVLVTVFFKKKKNSKNPYLLHYINTTISYNLSHLSIFIYSLKGYKFCQKNGFPFQPKTLKNYRKSHPKSNISPSSPNFVQNQHNRPIYSPPNVHFGEVYYPIQGQT